MNKSMDMSAENVIENWANYVNQSDLPGLMGLYAKDATLVPTFSWKILHTPEEIEQYFFGACQKGNSRRNAQENSPGSSNGNGIFAEWRIYLQHEKRRKN